MDRRAMGAGLCLLLAGTLSLPAQATESDGAVQYVGEPGAAFSSAVVVGDTIYLSGMMAPPDVPADKAKGTPAVYRGDTKSQAIGALKQIDATLSAMGLGIGDVVQLTAFLTGDPAKGGGMDLQGWNEAYKQFFGTAEQPHKPVRATVQVASLVYPTGRIEIMVIAARHRSAAK